MTEKMNKSEFIERCALRIENRNKLSNFRKTTFVDVLNKFEGKVYNKRFRDALTNAFGSDMFYISESGESLVLNLQNSKTNYRDYESLYFNLVTENNRISAEKTLSEKYTTVWLENFDKETESIRESAESYDLYLAKAEQLEKMLEDFSKIPYAVRQNFTDFKTWYLR